MKSALVFSILVLAFSQKPSLNIAIRNSEVEELKNQLLPVFLKNMTDMVIPDMNVNSGSLKCTMSNIHVKLGSLNPKDIHINFQAGTNTIKSNGEHLSVSVTCHAKCSYLFITVEPDVLVNVKEITYAGTVTLGVANQQPSITLGALTVGINPNNMDITFSNTPIKIILDLIVPLFKSTIISQVNSMAANDIPKMVNDIISGLMKTIPIDIPFYNGLGVHSVAQRSPLCENDKLVIYEWSYGVDLKNPKLPPYQPKDMPDFSTCTQGIQVIVSEYIADSILYAAYNAGLLVDTQEISYEGVKGTISCVTNDVPDFQFKNDVFLKYFGTCEFKGTYNGKAVAVKASGVLNGDGDMNVKNEKIFFSIQELIPTITNIISISGMTAAEFQQLINKYANELENTINNGIGKNGIDLPMIDGIDYSNSVSAMKMGYMEVCSTPVINIKKYLE